jgi:hypothetical protein
MAELIIDGKPSIDIAPLSIERFAKKTVIPEERTVI